MLDQGLPATITRQDYRAAISQCEGARMPKFNWRSSDDYYKRVEEAVVTGFAWECLRRNPGFQREHRITVPATELRKHWGLIFRR